MPKTPESCLGAAQDVPRAFAQRVCESAQSDGPLEGTVKHLAELPAFAVMVLGMWHLAEGILVLVPAADLAQWLWLSWTDPKRSAGYK